MKKTDRVQTHTQNVYYLLPLDCNNGNANAPQYYVIRILPVLLTSVTSTPLNPVQYLMRESSPKFGVHEDNTKFNTENEERKSAII